MHNGHPSDITKDFKYRVGTYVCENRQFIFDELLEVFPVFLDVSSMRLPQSY
jgi:hypothetical protein